MIPARSTAHKSWFRANNNPMFELNKPTMDSMLSRFSKWNECEPTLDNGSYQRMGAIDDKLGHSGGMNKLLISGNLGSY